MGVVLSMGMINAPPEVLGHAIGGALVGAFLGILLCYGIFGPMGSKLENLAHEQLFLYKVIREAVAASARGSPPIMALEFGRRAIPYDFRPTFLEMEEKLRG
jgi:chemotaxis protein MotA